MPKPTRCISPSGAVRLTGQKKPDRSFTMSMPMAISSASKSCPPARYSRPETGKKLPPGPAPPGRRLARLRRRFRDPRVWEEIRREAAMMVQHPEDEAINDWIEAVYDWESWK